jgi:hypothetical protein
MTPRQDTSSHGQHCKIIPYSSITVRNIKHSVDVLDTSVVIKHFAYYVGSNHVVCKTLSIIFCPFPDVKNVILVTVFLSLSYFKQTQVLFLPSRLKCLYIHIKFYQSKYPNSNHSDHKVHCAYDECCPKLLIYDMY